VVTTFEECVATLTERIAQIPAFGKKLKFMLDDNIMHVDGTANPPSVTTTDGPSDAVITVSVDNFSKLLKKELNPMIAFTTGKVRLKGDMAAATALQKIF
jgi:putative sterol carrier protein